MKKINTLYYLLFVLIIFGAFASMAQNDYGVKLLGWVSAAFSLIFIVQFIQIIQQKKKKPGAELLELASVAILASILSMRVFYFRFQFVEIIFGLAGLALCVVYTVKMLSAWKSIKPKNPLLAWMILIFYSSIVLYILAIVTVPFMPAFTEPLGGMAFLLVIVFAVVSIAKRNLMVSGELVTGLNYIIRFKDKAVLLMALFILFTSYMGLTKAGMIPALYSDEYPQAYFELVNQAEMGKEKPMSGKFKHEEFKQKYDQFVKRNSADKNP